MVIAVVASVAVLMMVTILLHSLRSSELESIERFAIDKTEFPVLTYQCVIGNQNNAPPVTTRERGPIIARSSWRSPIKVHCVIPRGYMSDDFLLRS